MQSTPLASEHRALTVLAPLMRAMWRAGRTGFAATFAAPTVLAGRCCFYMLLMTIITALWSKVVEEQVSGGLAYLLPAGGLGFYVGVTEVATLGVPAIYLRLEDDIRSGLIEVRLLRPKSHLLLRIAEALGGALARMIALAACGGVLLAFSDFSFPSPIWWPGLLLVMALAAVVGVLILAIVGLSVFRFGRVLPVHIVVQKISFLLGGLMAPVTLYPDWLANVSMASPFAAQLYWPAKMVTDPSLETYAVTLAWQALWIVLLGALTAWLWSRGVARILRQGA